MEEIWSSSDLEEKVKCSRDWEKAIREALGRWEEYGRDRGIEGSDKCRRSLRQPPSIEGRISREGQPIPRLTSLWHVSPPRDALRVQGTSSGSGFLWWSCKRSMRSVSQNMAQAKGINDVLSRGIPVSEASEPIRLLRPRRISRAFWLRPVFGVGGRDASMNGMESSSKSGDFDLWDAKVNNLADCVF